MKSHKVKRFSKDFFLREEGVIMWTLRYFDVAGFQRELTRYNHFLAQDVGAAF